ncbi:tigger transposable element-derived protein 6-like [Daktulosphaira vitifoliae]|uniref:tigger transposable element-derived protein 6-like n=1 Tax=Daktulosphaira vitifoliae TaxID=58002 RepID=UPI0021A98AFA|nr:tigger transposable element-derived protein 6-like [Daktulosphaira vitifoliae]
MDQGIIQNFKTLYRKEIIRKIVYDIDEGKPCSINLLQSMRMCEKVWRNVQPSTIVNCFKKVGFYFNDEQFDGDGLENNDDDDGGYDWQIVADKLNIDQEFTFQSYVTIDDNVVVSGMLTDKEIMGINISNSGSKNNEDDEPETTLNMITANQAMSSLQTVRQFVESVEGVDTSIFESIDKLEDFVNKQPKNQKLIIHYFSTVSTV